MPKLIVIRKNLITDYEVANAMGTKKMPKITTILEQSRLILLSDRGSSDLGQPVLVLCR